MGVSTSVEQYWRLVLKPPKAFVWQCIMATCFLKEERCAGTEAVVQKTSGALTLKLLGAMA